MALRNSLQVLLVVCGIALAGCATMAKVKPVAVGDQVGVQFTCRLKNGDIAISTDRKVAKDTALPKSVLFSPRDQEGPLMITTETTARNERDSLYAPFEDRVVKRIAAAVVGMTPGDKHTVTIMAEREDAYLKADDIFLTMSRVRHRPKEITLDIATFRTQMNKLPVVGEDVELDGLPVRVISVKGVNVLLSLAAMTGKKVRTPFGMGTIKDTPDDVEIDMDVRAGTLVRTGPLAGRISRVDDTTFTIDFGHPFGGEELSCDIVVEPVAKAVNKGEEHAEK